MSDDRLLEQLAGEMMSVYVGSGQKIPRSYTFYHGDNQNIEQGERVIVSVRRVPFSGRLSRPLSQLEVLDYNPT